MPQSDWTVDVVSRLRRFTDREIRVRAHPGARPHPPLTPDLADCWAAVTWGSGAGVKALCEGVPVFHELAGWIGACQGMFPGVAMTRSGAVLHTRGALLCEWEARAPGGPVMARGVNHGRLSAAGRLAGVEGFWRA